MSFFSELDLRRFMWQFGVGIGGGVVFGFCVR